MNAIIPDFQVNENSGPNGARQSHSSVSVDGGAVGTNFRVANTSVIGYRRHDVALFNGWIYNTWSDNRAGGTGDDIWANPTGIIDKELSQAPSAFILNQNYPSPFSAKGGSLPGRQAGAFGGNPSTTIEYALPKSGLARITIFDLLGRPIRSLVNANQPAGQYQTSWDGMDENNIPVAAGIYFCKMVAGGHSTSFANISGQPKQYFVKVNKLVLVR